MTGTARNMISNRRMDFWRYDTFLIESENIKERNAPVQIVFLKYILKAIDTIYILKNINK